MYFMVIGTDKPNSLALRTATRKAHRNWLRGDHASVTVLQSGASLNRDSTTMDGSLLIVAAESYNDVLLFSQADPYFKANLFETVDIRRWDWTYGNPDGSTTSVNPV